MPSPFEEEIRRDVEEIDDEIPSEFIWQGGTFTCFADTWSREVIIGEDGNPEEIVVKLRARLELFAGGRPESGDEVTFEDVIYKVRRVRVLHNVFLWVDLMSVNR
jgi:hypothetical protein